MIRDTIYANTKKMISNLPKNGSAINRKNKAMNEKLWEEIMNGITGENIKVDFLVEN